MTRRRRKFDAEALDIIDRVVERMNLQLAAVARASVDLADGDRTAEQPARANFERLAELGQNRVLVRQRLGVRLRRGDSHRPREQRFQQQGAHQRSCPEYEQLNDLLQSGKSATMLFSIAASNSGHWNHDASRAWARAMRPPSMRTETSTSPRKASVMAMPSPEPSRSSTRAGPDGRLPSQCRNSAMLCSTSRIRTQTRASTSPAVNT